MEVKTAARDKIVGRPNDRAMVKPTPAEQLEAQRAALDWAEQIQQHQPEELQAAYEQAAAEIVATLTQATYHVSIQLPHILYHNHVMVTVPPKRVAVHAGSLFDTLRRHSCAHILLKALTQLTHHPMTAVSVIARYTSYLAAKRLLLDVIPPLKQIDEFRLFDVSGQPSVSLEQARSGVDQLSLYVQWIRAVEQLYPGWASDDRYDEKYAHLIIQLTAQGRFLANYETRQMIDEILTRWRAGDPLSGLQLSFPYLDERQYQIRQYKVVVIPTARIPFRPEFVLGASRVEQQRVRKNPQLSQSTRWQLISQLDSIIQTFEQVVSASNGGA